MVGGVLSVCWENHSSEVLTQYKSLLEDNFLVDCTLSAEGQSLKAHRLVLSACSPYFRMLFREETGKHAFVILLDAKFETVRAVIEFVYLGETRISEDKLDAFLTLVHNLQIKGLNASFKDYKNMKVSTSTNEDVLQCPSEDNAVSSAVENISVGRADLPENNSQQQPDHFIGFTDAEHTNSSIIFEEYSAVCEQVQSASVLTSLQKHQKVGGCDQVFADPEITEKNEPSISTMSLETRNEEINNFESEDAFSGNFISNINGRTDSLCGENDFNQFSSCCESHHGNVESSVVQPSPLQSLQLKEEVSFGEDDEKNEILQPQNLVLKNRQMDIVNYGESAESMEVPDAPGENMFGADEEPVNCEENSDQCSKSFG